MKNNNSIISKFECKDGMKEIDFVLSTKNIKKIYKKFFE